MSILKFENRTPRTLSDIFKYLTDPEKTDERGIFGIGCEPQTAVEEMTLTSLVYPRQKLTHAYLQVIFSFDNNIDLSFEKIREICVEIGKVLIHDDRQIFGAIHYLGNDSHNIHCHYLINFVGIDGTLYQQKYSVWTYKKLVNEILTRYGLNEIKIYEPDCSFHSVECSLDNQD